jgi:hypothetical protein
MPPTSAVIGADAPTENQKRELLPTLFLASPVGAVMRISLAAGVPGKARERKAFKKIHALVAVWRNPPGPVSCRRRTTGLTRNSE